MIQDAILSITDAIAVFIGFEMDVRSPLGDCLCQEIIYERNSVHAIVYGWKLECGRLYGVFYVNSKDKNIVNLVNSLYCNYIGVTTQRTWVC